jgi:UDP-glucose 4-epimerase
MKLADKRVLVAGGCGFIGSHLCERLVDLGAEVVVLDNLSSGDRTNVSTVAEQLTIQEGDISDEARVAEVVAGCDVVIHQAYPYGRANWGVDEQYATDGVIGTINLLRASVKEDVSKFVFASSVAVYGLQEYLPLDEDHPTTPIVPYGATKQVGEEYCRTFASLYGLDTVSLRYFYAYGPRYASFDHSAMVKFLNLALQGKPITVYGDGEQIRDYTYIKDVVTGTLDAARADGTDGAVYNISSGTGVSIIKLAEIIGETISRSVDIHFTEVPAARYDDEYCQIPRGMTSKKDGQWVDERDYVGDNSRARTELGYEPKTDLSTGIRQTLDWMDAVER